MLTSKCSNISDSRYRHACWLTANIYSKHDVLETVSGPKDCGVDPGSCCQRIRFDSSGTLANSAQNHIIGDYVQDTHGPGDKWNYRQVGGSDRRLWFNPDVKVSWNNIQSVYHKVSADFALAQCTRFYHLLLRHFALSK